MIDVRTQYNNQLVKNRKTKLSIGVNTFPSHPHPSRGFYVTANRYTVKWQMPSNGTKTKQMRRICVNKNATNPMLERISTGLTVFISIAWHHKLWSTIASSYSFWHRFYLSFQNFTYC